MFAGALPNIEPQIRLAILRVRTVAMEAIVRQNRPHVAIEIERLRRPSAAERSTSPIAKQVDNARQTIGQYRASERSSDDALSYCGCSVKLESVIYSKLHNAATAIPTN